MVCNLHFPPVLWLFGSPITCVHRVSYPMKGQLLFYNIITVITTKTNPAWPTIWALCSCWSSWPNAELASIFCQKKTNNKVQVKRHTKQSFKLKRPTTNGNNSPDKDSGLKEVGQCLTLNTWVSIPRPLLYNQQSQIDACRGWIRAEMNLSAL